VSDLSHEARRALRRQRIDVVADVLRRPSQSGIRHRATSVVDALAWHDRQLAQEVEEVDLPSDNR